MNQEKLTDVELVKKTIQDGENFGYIIERYEPKLMKYIMRISDITYEEAEDLLQEIFIKVYKNIFEFNQSLAFSSWIYRIAHNYLIDYFRKTSKKETISLDNEEYSFLINNIKSEFNPEIDLAKKETREVVQKTLRKLKPEYREVLVLKFIEDKSYDEISDILRIPTGTVGTLINRAKKEIKENF